MIKNLKMFPKFYEEYKKVPLNLNMLKMYQV